MVAAVIKGGVSVCVFKIGETVCVLISMIFARSTYNAKAKGEIL